MKKIIFSTSLSLISIFTLFGHPRTAQDYLNSKGEVFFSFTKPPTETLINLSQIISIDKVTGDSVYAYACKLSFDLFSQLEIPYTTLKHPGETDFKSKNRSNRSEYDFSYYPSYNTYTEVMYAFESNFPELCEIIDFGTSVQNRSLLCARISNFSTDGNSKAKVLYTSTMHGDETAGYIVLLKLIDYLTNNYDSDTTVQNLLNNCEIWVNPLANPDGIYVQEETTIAGAKRYNANNVDLNRNFPDPEIGDHPDQQEWQPETMAFMQLVQENQFTISANIHSGTEVLNYPWDTWQTRHADDIWWQTVTRNYASLAQTNSPQGYMDDMNNGITNGYDWYSIKGGRQDYMNYYANCKEFTIEILTQKVASEDTLLDIWQYNKQSLLSYAQEAMFGIQGRITDAATQEPIEAFVVLNHHDNNNSYVKSNNDGFFFRPVSQGVYSVSICKEGYLTYSTEITTNTNNATYISIELEPDYIVLKNDNSSSAFQNNRTANTCSYVLKTEMVNNLPFFQITNNTLFLDQTLPVCNISITDTNGKIHYSKQVDQTNKISLKTFSSGIYFISANIEHRKLSGSFLISK